MENSDIIDEVFEHFGMSIDEIKKEQKEFDFIIYDADKAVSITGNMAGFGLENSQRIIIDYDKDFDKILVRREKQRTVAK